MRPYSVDVVGVQTYFQQCRQTGVLLKHFICNLLLLDAVTMFWTIAIFRSADPHPVESVCLGAFARSMSGFTMLPITVIKTRFEVSWINSQKCMSWLKILFFWNIELFLLAYSNRMPFIRIVKRALVDKLLKRNYFGAYIGAYYFVTVSGIYLPQYARCNMHYIA